MMRNAMHQQAEEIRNSVDELKHATPERCSWSGSLLQGSMITSLSVSMSQHRDRRALRTGLQARRRLSWPHPAALIERSK